MSKRYLFFVIVVLALAALACNAGGPVADSQSEEAELGAPAEEQPAEAGQDQPAAQPPAGEAAASQEQPVAQPPAGEAVASQEQTVAQPPAGEAAASQEQPAAQPSALPIGMRQGLASLNSYRLIMKMANIGPTAQDISKIDMELRYSADDDARYMRNESLESTAEYPDTSVSLEETYQIGLQSCSVSTYDGTSEATPEEMTPLVRDMTEATANLFDINITVENPSLVGPETINGIPSDHYTFQVTGLGDFSGQEVTQANGEYWVAQDGQYLVKYSLVLEVRSAPEGDPSAEVMHSEYTFDLMEVNQPQTITMPPDCLF